jgi:hypothetical protein
MCVNVCSEPLFYPPFPILLLGLRLLENLLAPVSSHPPPTAAMSPSYIHLFPSSPCLVTRTVLRRQLGFRFSCVNVRPSLPKSVITRKTIFGADNFVCYLLACLLFTQTDVRGSQLDARHCDEGDRWESECLCAQHVHVSARPVLVRANLRKVIPGALDYT